MALSEQEREEIRSWGKKIISGVIHFMAVAGLDPEEIDADYEAVKKEFQELPPEKIGV